MEVLFILTSDEEEGRGEEKEDNSSLRLIFKHTAIWFELQKQQSI